jgi:hypothetical protein
LLARVGDGAQDIDVAFVLDRQVSHHRLPEMSAARRSCYNEHEAWVLPADHWVVISRILRGNAVRELTKDKFDQLYPESAATAADRLPQRVRQPAR